MILHCSYLRVPNASQGQAPFISSWSFLISGLKFKAKDHFSHTLILFPADMTAYIIIFHWDLRPLQSLEGTISGEDPILKSLVKVRVNA